MSKIDDIKSHDGSAVLAATPGGELVITEANVGALLREMGVPEGMIAAAMELPATSEVFEALLIDAADAIREMANRGEPIDMGANDLLRGDWLKYCRKDLIGLHLKTWLALVQAHYQAANTAKAQAELARKEEIRRAEEAEATMREFKQTEQYKNMAAEIDSLFSSTLIRRQAKSGGDARAAKYTRLKILATRLVEDKSLQSRTPNYAAGEIMEEVMSKGKEIGVPLRKSKAQATIAGWIKPLCTSASRR
jgi:hypothetical protein